MFQGDPAAKLLEGNNTYECPDCGHRTLARGSCCCSECGVRMHNISRPRDL
jgi:DNA-directed RNA polymerase subunit RPC12/RpoP